MAYGDKYYISFTNRENIFCAVVISEKDYEGSGIDLKGAERPFTLSSTAQDNQIPYGIKATEAIIEFYTGGLVSIDDFYSEDDDHWMVTFVSSFVVAWTGFLQIDNCQERITDTDHILSLNANDGLGRLENLYFFDDSLFGGGNPRIVNWRVDELLANILLSTGLDLQVKAWLNIYENSTEDRTDFDYLTFLTQTAFSTAYFVNDDGTTASYYEALNNFLTDFRCELTQAEGCWQIIRWGDVRLFGDGTMPGTLYSSSFGSYELINKESPIAIGLGLPVHPINENQLRQILRPYQYSKETMKYEQSVYIIQSNFELPAGATPYETNTVDGIRTDKYDLATYFTSWHQRNGDTSYMYVITDTNVEPEQELERGVHKPADFDTHSGVQFNPLSVSAGDTFDFSLQFKTHHSDGFFWVRFILILADGTYYSLEQDTGLSPDYHIFWTGPFPADEWFNESIGVRVRKDGEDETWAAWNLSQFYPNTDGDAAPDPVLIPASGFLLIEVDGNSSTWDTGFGTYSTDWKDIELILNQYINESNKISGQVHLTQQDKLIKNNLQYEVFFDDSPRNTIKGTLFTDELTNYDYTDTDTGEETLIGSQYTTKTHAWHRSDIDEARRLGDLNTNNDLFIQRIPRTIIQGDFFGLSGINLMSIISFSWLPDKRFIFGAASFDYMSGIWNASLYELYDTTETDGDLDSTYTFTYIYETQR